MSKAYQNTIAAFAITLGAFKIFEKAYTSDEFLVKTRTIIHYSTRLVKWWPTQDDWEKTVELIDVRFRDWETKHMPQLDVNPLLITSSIISILGDLSIHFKGEKRDRVDKLFEMVVEFNKMLENISQTSPELSYKQSMNLAKTFVDCQNA